MCGHVFQVSEAHVMEVWGRRLTARNRARAPGSVRGEQGARNAAEKAEPGGRLSRLRALKKLVPTLQRCTQSPTIYAKQFCYFYVLA